MAKIAVPRGVQAAGRAFIRSVEEYLTRERLLPEAHEVLIIVQAARVADRIVQIETALSGADFTDAATVRLLTEERQQRSTFANLVITKLGLPTGIGAANLNVTGSTPKSRRGQAGATHRWGKGGGVAS